MKPLKYLGLALGLMMAVTASLIASVRTEVVDPYWEVRVKPDRACGSGAVVEVGGEKLILTAGHVVADALKVGNNRYYEAPGAKGKGSTYLLKGTVQWEDVYLYKKEKDRERKIKGQVVFYSPAEGAGGLDLALIKPASCEGLVPVNYKPGVELEDGEDAFYIGTGGGLHARLEKSIVARPFVETDGAGNFWTTNGNGYYGNSGGPAFVKRDGKWVLAGVILRMYVGDPRGPMLARLPETIDQFLADYQSFLKENQK